MGDLGRCILFLGFAWVFGSSATHANPARPYAPGPISVIDDTGRHVTLSHPAQRVISLAPHTTELLYAAGGHKALIGAVAYSDYPVEAQALPRVGNYRALDIERIVSLKPDLIVAWKQPGAQRVLDRLHALHIPIFYSDPHTLRDIATTLKRLGTLLGTSATAYAAATQFEKDINALRQRYAHHVPVRVFYQVADRPLITLNGQALINDLLKNCAGINVFATQLSSAPIVSTEAMLATKPDVIIISQPTTTQSASARQNQDAQTDPLPANPLPAELQAKISKKPASTLFYPQTFSIQSALLDRPGPRLVQGGRQLCAILEDVRRTRLQPETSAPHGNQKLEDGH